MEVIPGIHRIPGSMVNCYLIVEPDGVTLIDAGMSKTKVLKYLTALGKQPADLKRIIITHADRTMWVRWPISWMRLAPGSWPARSRRRRSPLGGLPAR